MDDGECLGSVLCGGKEEWRDSVILMPQAAVSLRGGDVHSHAKLNVVLEKNRGESGCS